MGTNLGKHHKLGKPTKKDTEIKCCVCKRKSFVTGIWHTHNPLTCKSKICVNVFKSLPVDMLVSLEMVNKEIRNRYLYNESESYYHRDGEEIRLVISNPLNGRTHGWCRSMNYIDNDKGYITNACLWLNYYDDFIINLLQESYDEGWHDDDPYIKEISFTTESYIYPKIKIEDIDEKIKELINLERTISLSKEILDICNSVGIDTYFCAKTQYSGFKDISINFN